MQLFTLLNKINPKSKAHLACALGLFIAFCSGCSQHSNEPHEKEQAHPDEWIRDAVIYEVNLRQITPEGTIEAFRKQLPELKHLGVKILWFMPIQPIGELNRKGSLGSYYSIRDYTAVNPEFGTLASFTELVKECHDMGFKVILDWVGNHSAFDHKWITEHPQWYVRDSLGNPIPPVPDWSDVADLNYESSEMCAAMIDALKFWVKTCDIDGYRCDVAFMVPARFWQEAKAALDSIKPLFMLAEAEEHDMGLYQNAFHSYYGWELHHAMNEVAQGKKSPEHFNYVYQKKRQVFGDSIFSMNFITNHDENSWNGTEFERMGEMWRAMAVLSYTWPGIPLLYTGQEYGLNKRLKFFDKDTLFPSAEKKSFYNFYSALNELKKKEPALHTHAHNNEIYDLKSNAEGLLHYRRGTGKDALFTRMNLSKTEAMDAEIPDKANILMQYGYYKGQIQPLGVIVYKN